MRRDFVPRLSLFSKVGYYKFRAAAKTFLHSMRLLQFNLFFSIQQHILRSTFSISFKAIYFRSKIYCTAVDRNKFVPSLHRILTGLYSPPFSRHFEKQRALVLPSWFIIMSLQSDFNADEDLSTFLHTVLDKAEQSLHENFCLSLNLVLKGQTVVP